MRRKKEFLKLEDKKTKTETMEYTLQKELETKEKEIYHLMEEQKVIQMKKKKLKSIVQQKDDIIEELRHQLEHLSRLNQSNEIHTS